MKIIDVMRQMNARDLASTIAGAQESAVKDFNNALGGNRETRRNRLKAFNKSAYMRQNLRILESDTQDAKTGSV